jgi:hypothetical protein
MADPDEVDVVPFDRSGFENVECLALVQTVNYVVQDHIAQPLQSAQMSERAADVASADKCSLLSSNAFSPDDPAERR